MVSTENYSQLDRLKSALEDADAIIIGAGAGLSTSAGLDYSGARFEELVGEYGAKYGYNHMYHAAFHSYPSLEAHWGYWSKHIYYNRFAFEPNNVYANIKKFIENKDYFVLTTNADHLFIKTGFNKEKIFYTQGDYGLFQCSKACHHKTYDNEDIIRKMVESQVDLCIPTELIPYCPKCNAPMDMNLRKDFSFIEDEGWNEAAKRYRTFLKEYNTKKILMIELGVGGNTPSIIKYPFWEIARTNKNAIYSCINLFEAHAPADLQKNSICIQEEITEVFQELTK